MSSDVVDVVGNVLTGGQYGIIKGTVKGAKSAINKNFIDPQKESNEKLAAAQKDTQDKIQKEKEDQMAQEDADKAASLNRKSALASQRKRAAASGGRRGTILTSPLGVIGGEESGARKTLLGS